MPRPKVADKRDHTITVLLNDEEYGRFLIAYRTARIRYPTERALSSGAVFRELLDAYLEDRAPFPAGWSST